MSLSGGCHCLVDWQSTTCEVEEFAGELESNAGGECNHQVHLNQVQL